MIDPSKERILPLVHAAKLLPSSRSSHGQHVATLYRWARKGVRGVRLEIIRIGGTTCTSQEALARFFAGQSPDELNAVTTSTAHRREHSRRVIEESGLTQPTIPRGRPATATKTSERSPRGDAENPVADVKRRSLGV